MTGNYFSLFDQAMIFFLEAGLTLGPCVAYRICLDKELIYIFFRGSEGESTLSYSLSASRRSNTVAPVLLLLEEEGYTGARPKVVPYHLSKSWVTGCILGKYLEGLSHTHMQQILLFFTPCEQA